jgi:uncharacterized protein
LKAATTPVAPRRVVIDTNVILSALLFNSGRMAGVQHAWQTNLIQPIVSRATAEELIAALDYPKFKLDAAEKQTVLAAYLPYCETIPTPVTRMRLPICRDADDQKFLLLAAAAKADALITGDKDKDLLALREEAAFAIITPQELIAALRA